MGRGSTPAIRSYGCKDDPKPAIAWPAGRLGVHQRSSATSCGFREPSELHLDDIVLAWVYLDPRQPADIFKLPITEARDRPHCKGDPLQARVSMNIDDDKFNGGSDLLEAIHRLGRAPAPTAPCGRAGLRRRKHSRRGCT